MATTPDTQRPVSTDSLAVKPNVMPRIFLADEFSRLYKGDGKSADNFLMNGGLHGVYIRVRNVLAQDKFKNVFVIVEKAMGDLRKQTHKLLRDHIPLEIRNKGEVRDVMEKVRGVFGTVQTKLAIHDVTAELRTALNVLEQQMHRAVEVHFDLPDVPGAASGKADDQGVVSGTTGAEDDSKNGVALVSMDAIHDLALPHVETLVGQIPQHQLSPDLLSNIMKTLGEVIHNGEPFSRYEFDYLHHLVMVTAESMIIDDLSVDLAGGMQSVEGIEDILKTHAFPSGTIWHQSSAHKLLRLCVQQKSFSRSLHMKRRMSEWGYDRIATSDADSREPERRTGGQAAASSLLPAAAPKETTVQDFTPLEEQHLAALFTERYRKNEPLNLDFMKQACNEVNVLIHGGYERNPTDMRRFENERWPTYLAALQGAGNKDSDIQPPGDALPADTASAVSAPETAAGPTSAEPPVEDFSALEEAYLMTHFAEQHKTGEKFSNTFMKQVSGQVNLSIHGTKKRGVKDMRRFEREQWKKHLETASSATSVDQPAGMGVPTPDEVSAISRALRGRKHDVPLDQAAIDLAIARMQRVSRCTLEGHEKERAITLLHLRAEYLWLEHVLPTLRQSKRTPYKVFSQVQELYVTRPLEGKNSLSSLVEGFVHGKPLTFEKYVEQRRSSAEGETPVPLTVSTVAKNAIPPPPATPSAAMNTTLPLAGSVSGQPEENVKKAESPSAFDIDDNSAAAGSATTPDADAAAADEEAAPIGPVEQFDEATIAREEALMRGMFAERLQSGKTIDKSFRNKVCNELNEKIHLGQKKRHKSYVRTFYDLWVVAVEKQKIWDDITAYIRKDMSEYLMEETILERRKTEELFIEYIGKHYLHATPSPDEVERIRILLLLIAEEHTLREYLGRPGIRSPEKGVDELVEKIVKDHVGPCVYFTHTREEERRFRLEMEKGLSSSPELHTRKILDVHNLTALVKQLVNEVRGFGISEGTDILDGYVERRLQGLSFRKEKMTFVAGQERNPSFDELFSDPFEETATPDAGVTAAGVADTGQAKAPAAPISSGIAHHDTGPDQIKVPEPPPAGLPARPVLFPFSNMRLSPTDTATSFGKMSAVPPPTASQPKPPASAETKFVPSETPVITAPPSAPAGTGQKESSAVPARLESPEHSGGIQLYVDRTRTFLTTLLSKVPTAGNVSNIFSNFRASCQRATGLRTALMGTEKLLKKDVGTVVHLAVPSSVTDIATLDAQGLRDEITALKTSFDLLKNYRDILQGHNLTLDELTKEREKAQQKVEEMQAMQKHILDLKDFRDGPFPTLLEGAALQALVPGANDASFDVEPEVSVDVDRYVHDFQQEMIVFTVRPGEEFEDKSRRERLLESISPTMVRLKNRRTDCLAALNELEMK